MSFFDRHSGNRHRWRLCRTTTTVPLLLFLTVSISILFIMKEAPDSPPHSGGEQPASVFFKYSVVPGYFLQDDPSTEAASFDFVRIPQNSVFAMDLCRP